MAENSRKTGSFVISAQNRLLAPTNGVSIMSHKNDATDSRSSKPKVIANSLTIEAKRRLEMEKLRLKDFKQKTMERLHNAKLRNDLLKTEKELHKLEEKQRLERFLVSQQRRIPQPKAEISSIRNVKRRTKPKTENENIIAPSVSVMAHNIEEVPIPLKQSKRTAASTYGRELLKQHTMHMREIMGNEEERHDLYSSQPQKPTFRKPKPLKPTVTPSSRSVARSKLSQNTPGALKKHRAQIRKKESEFERTMTRVRMQRSLDFRANKEAMNRMIINLSETYGNSEYSNNNSKSKHIQGSTQIHGNTQNGSEIIYNIPDMEFEDESHEESSVNAENERFIRALQHELRSKARQLGVELPHRICNCPHDIDILDTEPSWERCANNCQFYRNPGAFAKALADLFKVLSEKQNYGL
eukprot:TRINITY_DN781919_c0_g1_i1.p1 TRINITY_DN781919_c0_g1~~TRINITY_DN781919_c0_g1_i1.p1  ORF type:complete len:412 (-),score=102.03 TRINITY_DN781919_c0_g1_i1:315-1550(-)